MCVSFVQMTELCPSDHSTYNIMKIEAFCRELITLPERFYYSRDESPALSNSSDEFIVSLKMNLYQMFQIFC